MNLTIWKRAKLLINQMAEIFDTYEGKFYKGGIFTS